MSSNTVRDRSGLGLPSKSERRALGKAAAQKRAQQRRRREIRNRLLQIAAPIAVVGIIVGSVYFFQGGDNPAAAPAATPTAAPIAQCDSIPADLQATLGTRPEVTAGEGTLSELKITTLVEGTGAPLDLHDRVCANYVGAYYNTAEVFDSSWEEGDTPLLFPLGESRVIAGWDEGLIGIPVGSRVILDIPVDLAYRHQEGYPDGDLRFVVDVLSAYAA